MQARARAATVALAAASAVTGCGGHPHAHAVTTPRARDLARLGADVRALRAAAAPIHGNTLLGTPRLRRATRRYVHDLETSSLDDRTRNRQIDFAVAAVAGSCDQCFQQLEAMRPIPALAGR